MAVFQFSALGDGQSLVFNPNADVLNFDQTTVAAADLRVIPVGANLRVEVVGGPQAGKDVTLQNMSQLQLATTNVTFADGSKLLFGDNSTAQNDNLANSLTGTAGRDFLQGFGGADTMNGGAGSDTYIVGTGDVLSDGGGVDTVVTDVNWTLGAGFENVQMIGAGNISATGNNDANLAIGNAGNNYFNMTPLFLVAALFSLAINTLLLAPSLYMNGLLTDFFDTQKLAAQVDEALQRQDQFRPLREAARRTVLERYDLKRVCLPAQRRLVEALLKGKSADARAAADVQQLAGDEAGLAVGEEQHRARDVARLA